MKFKAFHLIKESKLISYYNHYKSLWVYYPVEDMNEAEKAIAYNKEYEYLSKLVPCFHSVVSPEKITAERISLEILRSCQI